MQKHYLQSIEKHPQKRNLLLKLRQQLAKDFQIELTQVPGTELHQWLKNHLENRMYSSQNLAQLLYRIDLAEERTAGLSAERLAWNILEREAQKVLFRAQYSGEL